MPQLHRTDADAMTKEPLHVRFGNTDYEIQVLRAKKARRWRAQLTKAFAELATNMQVENDQGQSDKFFGAMGWVFLQFPEKIEEMLKLYAPDLPWEKILDEDDEEHGATDEQIVVAWSYVCQIANPYAPLLALTKATLTAATELKASAMESFTSTRSASGALRRTM